MKRQNSSLTFVNTASSIAAIVVITNASSRRQTPRCSTQRRRTAVLIRGSAPNGLGAAEEIEVFLHQTQRASGSGSRRCNVCGGGGRVHCYMMEHVATVCMHPE